VEQHDRPELRGLPVIVGGSGGRGVVAAASYEVRRFGVRSAMPVRRALALCPQAICVSPRMARYAEISAQVFEVFHAFTPLVQGLSLDEAFLDVTDSRMLHGAPELIARDIKRLIRERTGLGASVRPRQARWTDGGDIRARARGARPATGAAPARTRSQERRAGRRRRDRDAR
jgi:DNA polymerase-4